MSELKIKIKKQLIEHLNLEDLKLEDIKDDTPLFGDGLGLDSIDALEIIVMLDTKFNIKISNPEEGTKIFQSVNTLAEFIENQNRIPNTRLNQRSVSCIVERIKADKGIVTCIHWVVDIVPTYLN